MKKIMNSGQLYHDVVEPLITERRNSQMLQYKYNHTTPEQIEERAKILKELMGEIKEPYWIEPPFKCSYGSHVKIGKGLYANFNLVILDDADVTIGNNVLFGPNVVLATAGHPENNVERAKGMQYSLPIVIGNGVWIGANVTINPGVTIGDNVIIGSGSVVTKDIPANSVAYGAPCKVRRQVDQSR